MKQQFLNLLERVVDEFGDRMTLDEDLLARLKLAKVITKSEKEKILAKETTPVRLLLLFDEILPSKEDSKMKELRDVFRSAGNEVVANFLAREILSIEVASESPAIASGSSSTGRTSRESPPETSILKRGVKALKAHMRNYFLGDQFATLKIMVSDDNFRIEDMWVNLEMKTPKGTDWAPVEDYESSLTESSLKNIPVIVRGEPGVGKSTLVKKICYDWASKSESGESEGFVKFDLLLPCRLREADPAKTIPELVLQQLKKSLAGMGSVIDNLSDDLESLFDLFKVLIVLDGWDEDLGNCEELKNLLTSEKQRRYSLLITTRPREMEPRDSRFRFYQIVGFDDDDKRKFIDNFSRTMGKLEQDAKFLKNELETKPHLNEMARIPLLLVSICTVEAASSARNTTELFTIVVEFILRRHAEKGLLKVPEDWQRDPRIINLGKLALEGLMQKDQEYQLVFKERDLKNRISPEIIDIGLLCRENEHQLQQASYNVSFPHKTFQEFFAALFIRSRFGENESLSKSLEKAEISGIEQWGSILKQTTVFLTGMTQVGESEKLEKTLNRNRLLSSFVSNEDELVFSFDDPILKECKDDKTGSAICRTAVEMYAKERERLKLKIVLRFEEFQFLLRFIGGMHFDEISLQPIKIPCFSFLSSGGDPTETPEPSSSPTEGSSHLSQVSCGRLLIINQDEEEGSKISGSFKSIRSLSFLTGDSLTLLDLTKIINSCPGNVEEISFSAELSEELLPFPSPSPDFLRSTAESHRRLRVLGFINLGENSFEPFLNVATAFPALATLRIGFWEFPSTATIREKLIPALRGFPSLRVLRVGKWEVDDDDWRKEVEAAVREARMNISVEEL